VDTRSITLASILFILIIGSISTVYGQIVNPITVTTDKSLYYEGETIVISGEVSEILYGYAVSLLVTGPNGDVILIDQLKVDQNKKFQTEITAGGQLMNETGSGTYTVSVLYATQNRTDETTFQYISSNPPADIASVSIPQGTSVPGCESFNECYVPYEVTVKVGGEVIWYNDDTAAHTVTAGSAADGPSGLFDSGLFMAGTTFSDTFESAGQFPYHCVVHPWMEGIVTVIDDSTTTGPPITVKTNSNHYNEGDTIYVSGEVSEILFGYAISLMMIAPNGDVILIDQILVDSNRKYQTSILAEGSLMIDDGVYTIQVLYATENRTAETTFTFTGSTNNLHIIFKDPRIIDSGGNDVYTLKVGTQYKIKSTIINQKDVELESFAYKTIVSRQGDSKPVSIAWITGNLKPGGSYSPSLSWIPEEAGAYDTILYLLDNVEAENQLAPPLSLSLTVVESSTSEGSIDITPPKILQPKDIVIDAENPEGTTRVTFDVLVIDDTDKIIQPTCNPRSGSSFTAGVYTVTCSARDSAGNYATPVSFTITVNPPETSIPSWVKNVAEFWCEDKIDDAAFIEGIQYLIDNGIIVVPSTSVSYSGSQEVPQWVKNNACWWSAGLITDKDFASGIEYLVRQGIIRV